MSQKYDLHACIVGHSFVRCLQDVVGGAPRILSHRDAAALNAPNWFRVQDHYHRVDFSGQSGYTVSMLQRDITSAGLLYPDVVIIESGSNDLCYRECDIDALVTGLFSYASMLREVRVVRLVIMASVLNRDRCRQVSPTGLSHSTGKWQQGQHGPLASSSRCCVVSGGTHWEHHCQSAPGRGMVSIRPQGTT